MRRRQFNPMHAGEPDFGASLSRQWHLSATPVAPQWHRTEAYRRRCHRSSSRVTPRRCRSDCEPGAGPAYRISGSLPEANRTVVNPRRSALAGGVPQMEPPCTCINCPCKCPRIRPIAAGVCATPVDDPRAPRVHYRLPWASLMACSAGAKRRRSRYLPYEARP